MTIASTLNRRRAALGLTAVDVAARGTWAAIRREDTDHEDHRPLQLNPCTWARGRN
jgi:hypothetical protein